MDERKRRIIAIAVTASDHLMKSVVKNVEESDSDEELERGIKQLLLWRQRKRLRGTLEKPARIENYVEKTIPGMKSMAFRQHFRMVPESFEALEGVLGPMLSKAVEEGRPVIDPRKQILATIWLLATPDSYRSVADRFDMGKSSLSNSFMRVVAKINEVSGDYIKWPQGNDILQLKTAFHKIKGMPGVIGAIDGSDVEVKAPKENSQYYINRKKRYTVTLQAVCDSKLRFTDCFAGYAGSTGDLRILRNSELYKAVNENLHDYFPQEEYIIGDKIYPVLCWLIPSFKNNGILTEEQKHFNNVHAGTRQVIERAFALLKGRFRRLKYLDMNRDDMIASVILACCVLHNICLVTRPQENHADYIEEGLPHINLHRPRQIVGHHDVLNQNDGDAKRNYLVTLL